MFLLYFSKLQFNLSDIIDLFVNIFFKDALGALFLSFLLFGGHLWISIYFCEICVSTFHCTHYKKMSKITPNSKSFP